MAERHSNSERQRLKNMLSDAIRVLCQNTVRYNVELSIEALIGLTVDGGRDVVIVSLNELIGKQAAADAAFGEEQYYDAADDSLYADEQVDYMEDENDDYPADEDANQEYDNSGDSYMPYNALVKEELTSTITYGNVQHNHFHPTSASAMTQYKTEPYVDNTQQYYSEPKNEHVGLQQGWPSVARPVISRSQAAGSGAQKRTKLASPGGKKLGRVGGKVSRDGGGPQKPAAVGKMQSLNGEDAVSQITLYTCGTCGAQMQHQASFQRHKRSHTSQQVFRCAGCRKVISRHDNLLSHQRRCQAYLSQFQQGDPGE